MHESRSLLENLNVDFSNGDIGECSTHDVFTSGEVNNLEIRTQKLEKHQSINRLLLLLFNGRICFTL